MRPAQMLRISAGVAAGEVSARPAGERGLPQAPNRLGVAAVGALRARAFGPGAPGSRSSSRERRLVTAEMRGFAAAISSVRTGRNWSGRVA